MSQHFAEFAKRIGTDGTIDAADVLLLRREAWPDGRISAGEAEAIVALNAALAERTPEWSDFFVEALCEHCLNAGEPKGYVGDETAAWLIGQLDADGQLESYAELELLVRLLERARNVPTALKDYALRQIEHAVLHGEGPTRAGGALASGSVNAAEAALLRRMLFASGGEGPACIGRAEAELLFRLKDASLAGDNAPEWKRLFVQGVANHLRGVASPAAQLDLGRAAELDRFMAEPTAGLGAFLARMATSRPDWDGAKRRLSGADEQFAGRAALASEGAALTASERGWLDAKLAEDPAVDAYEQALLDFLADEG